MKKVICVDAGPSKIHRVPAEELTEGKEYTVYSERVDFYGILGYDVGLSVEYGAWRFIPLSEIDETEMIREYKKELV